MINHANARKDRIIKNKFFKDEMAFEAHINYIKEQDKKLDFQNRTCEVRNWMDYLKLKTN